MTKYTKSSHESSPLKASIAVDLGAESCRVSLLRWNEDKPIISLVHRFENCPREIDGALRWDIEMIAEGVEQGLRRCAELVPEGVRSIAVDGWAVDYVRLSAEGVPLADPFCYRDERTIEAEMLAHQRCSRAHMRELTGIQIMRINTVYQLFADQLAGLAEGEKWMNLPEYLLARWGGDRVAEYTNATHTQLVDLRTKQWCTAIFGTLDLDLAQAPDLVPSGAVVGKLKGPLTALSAFAETLLIAPACHDTASAIAGIPATGDDWAYISSGTWSLVGTLLKAPVNTLSASEENFTNLGAVGGYTCFHKNVNGMWLLTQCMDQWRNAGHSWTVSELVSAAEKVQQPTGLLDVDHSDLLLAGGMLDRINSQRKLMGYEPLDQSPENAPEFANLIFHSLASRYAAILKRVEHHTGKRFKRLFIVGGASQNEFLNRLTVDATGLSIYRGSPESSTIGNFAIQLAALNAECDATSGALTTAVARYAEQLNGAFTCSPERT